MRHDIRYVIPLLASAMLLTGCSSQNNALSLQVSILPQPLRVGTARVVAVVHDSRGIPVHDARVTVITSEPAIRMGYQMPMEGMGRAAQTIAATDGGNGIYEAAVHITEPTLWSIVVHANSASGSATLQIYERAEPAARAGSR